MTFAGRGFALLGVYVGRLAVYLEHETVVAEAMAAAATNEEFRAQMGVVAHKLAAIVRGAREGEDGTLAQ
jgi:hypothetical protein